MKSKDISSKILNISRVIMTLWQQQSISRIEVAEVLGLDKSTITKIIHLLMQKDLIKEVSARSSHSQGGRPKVSLSLNNDIGILVGVELQDSQMSLSVVDVSCKVLYRKIIPLNGRVKSLNEVVELLIPEIADIEAKFSYVLAVGVGMPGLIDPQQGLVEVSYAFEVDEPIALVELLSQKLPYPVYCDNDANCAAWGELMQSRGHPIENSIYVLFTTHHQHRSTESLGIGLGFVLNGQIFYGDDFLAGQYSSAVALTKENATVAEIMSEFTHALMIIGRVLNIRHVFIGGEAEKYGSELVSRIQELKPQESGPATWQPEIIFSTLGTQAVSAGAAAMAWQKLLGPELLLMDVLEQRAEKKLLEKKTDEGNVS
jgi:predicted NBD/HSP70 family sugar kinase